MDGSSFSQIRTNYAGVAMVDLGSVICAISMLPGTSGQQAELTVLTQALKLVKEAIDNMYTDSRFIFATVHVYRSIFQERGLLTAEGKNIKKKD